MQGVEKGRGKSKGKILRLRIQNPEITAREVSDALDLSIAGVEKTIRMLKGQKNFAGSVRIKAGGWIVFMKKPGPALSPNSRV